MEAAAREGQNQSKEGSGHKLPASYAGNSHDACQSVNVLYPVRHFPPFYNTVHNRSCSIPTYFYHF